MNIYERISVKAKRSPFPSPLPVPISTLLHTFQKDGFLFEELDSWTIMMNAPYCPDRLLEVENIVEAKEWDLDVTRSVWPEFNDQDFQDAPLWLLNFYDHWIDDIDFSSVCDECDRKRVTVNTDVRVPAVNSKKPLLSVNGQFTIVNAEVQIAIAKSLAGACFYPFDKQGRYYYLRAEKDLGQLMVKEDEAIDFLGHCSQCGLPIFKTYYGPLRYAKSLWADEDIVCESFHDGQLFTPKAHELLRNFDKSVSRDGIALLD